MTKPFPVTIYHNPKCGTSRNALAMIESAGYQPDVVEYLQTGWRLDQLKDLLSKLALKAHDILRTKGTPAEELGLTRPGVAEDVILKAMVEHPVLVNRPIVVTPKGAKLCRPCEEVVPLLERAPASYVQEEGHACDIKK